jgi:hypothetical protein
VLAHDLNHARARRELAVLDGKLDPEDIIDPEAPPAPAPAATSAVQAQRFACPKCGGRMVYAPDGRSLVCEFCARHKPLDLDGGEAPEQDFLVAMSTARGHRPAAATATFSCRGCGAGFLLPAGVISAACAYCDSPHVVSLELARELHPPDGILPQAFGRPEAVRLLEGWLESNGIQPARRPPPPRGLYLPAWTFDLGGALEYRGELVETVNTDGGRQRVVRRVQDSFPVDVDDLPVPASRKLAAHLGRLLPGYDLKSLRPYDPRYLADWPAEVYDIPLADASLDARSRAYERERALLPRRLGLPIQDLRTSSARLTVSSYKLVLLPVWMADYTLDGREYLVLVNGQTGAVEGDLPARPGFRLRDWLGDLLND